MRAHCLQHVPFEGPAAIEKWLADHNAGLTYTQLFDPVSIPTFPELDAFDLLIIMGGPMSTYDETDYDWLAAEKRFIRTAVEANKSVLGICLGAQLMAAAFDASVHPGPAKEIGWHPLTGVNNDGDGFQFPKSFTALHWHGDTFDIPPGAIHLATSDAVPNQAFQIGDRAVGLQFHIEATPESVSAITENCRHELVSAPWIQDEATILNGIHHCADANQLLFELLDYITV